MVDTSKNRRKSPSFPSLSLSRAIPLVSRVYSAAFDSALDTQTLLEVMGFRGVSGASRTALASLKQFGLIEGRDANNHVTKLAIQILHPVEEIERVSAIIEASRKPPIFGEILSQFKGIIPEDKVVKAFLIRNHGFSEVGAETLIKCLRETEEYVFPIRQNYKEMVSAPNSNTQTRDIELGSTDLMGAPLKRTENDEIGADEIIKVRLSPTCYAMVSLKGEVNQKAIEKLIAFLDLSKDGYPSS